MTEDQDKKKEIMNSHCLFIIGPRACIVQNISYFEQIVIITAIKSFDGYTAEGF